MFWTIIFYIYIFSACASFIMVNAIAFEVNRKILFKMPNYYSIVPRMSPVERFFKLSQGIVICAIPILNFFLPFFCLYYGGQWANEIANSMLNEVKKEGD